MSNRLLQSGLMPDTCLSLEIPQIRQISALSNESLGKSGKWSMYSSEEGKMQMKTNEKSLSFMFQVPNYAWHFNFPKARFRKIVLNSPQSVKASISSSSGIKQVWFSSLWGAKCNHCHCAAQLASRRSTECLGIFMDGLQDRLCDGAGCKRRAQPIAARVGADGVWWLACGLFCAVSGNSGCLPLACGLFHTRISMLCVYSQKVLSPLEICRRNL